MKIFSHLRLGPHKGLKEAVLIDLKQINVLCGPNGGGKSSALECVAQNTLKQAGVCFDQKKAEEIESDSAEHIRWHDPAYARYYSAGIKAALGQDKIWFQGDVKTLWANVAKFFHEKSGARLDIAGNFKAAFEKHFPENPSLVLIPAKRNLDPVTQINTGESIQSGGRGLLNFLFKAKNKDGSSSSRKKYDQILSAFSTITGGCSFDITLRDTNNEIELRFKMPGTDWLFADDCGLGYRDMLIMLYFALAAEEEVILIEEPENHLHPEIQRKLLAYLKANSAKQFFLSTHSSVFLDTQFVDRVFSCRLADTVRVENATSRAQLLTELGYSIADNIVSDLVVLCEGPKDKLVLEEFFRKLGYLEKFKIKVWPLGGDIMDQLDLSVFGESHRSVALIDKDPKSAKVRKNFLQNCATHKVEVHQLDRYAIENYFTVPAIRAVMPSPIFDKITMIDPSKKVADQLGFEVKNNSRRIAEAMSLSDIKGTDFETFLTRLGAILVAK